MEKYKRSLSYILIILCILLIFPMVSFAHSGRTDSRGGHKDNNNKSGLGYYHYHCGGHPAHLHPDGVCPYSGYSDSNDGRNSNNNNNNYNYGSNNSNYQDYITIKDYPKSMKIGDNTVIDFTMYSYYNDFSYTITSTDLSVIRVNGNILQAVGAGSSDIIIETSHTSKTVTIQVEEVFAKNFKIYSKLKELQLGERLSIVYRIEPNNTTNKEVKFLSSNTNVAVIEGDVIVPVGVGDVTITGKTSNGLTDSFDISIYEVFPEEIITNINSIELEITDTYKLECDIKPSNANNKECKFVCENKDIASIGSDGVITPIKDGNTNIIIQADANDISKIIPLKVFCIPCEKVDIIDSTNYLISNFIDESNQILLDSKISPDNATYQDVTWSSSDSNIVSIENDSFKINGTGKVTITCTSKDGAASSIIINVINKNHIICGLIFFVISGAFVIFYSVNFKNNKSARLQK